MKHGCEMTAYAGFAVDSRYLGSDQMHKVVSEGNELRQKTKGMLPGDDFGNIFRVGRNVEVSDLKQSK